MFVHEGNRRTLPFPDDFAQHGSAQHTRAFPTTTAAGRVERAAAVQSGARGGWLATCPRFSAEMKRKTIQIVRE